MLLDFAKKLRIHTTAGAKDAKAVVYRNRVVWPVNSIINDVWLEDESGNRYELSTPLRMDVKYHLKLQYAWYKWNNITHETEANVINDSDASPFSLAYLYGFDYGDPLDNVNGRFTTLSPSNKIKSSLYKVDDNQLNYWKDQGAYVDEDKKDLWYLNSKYFDIVLNNYPQKLHPEDTSWFERQYRTIETESGNFTYPIDVDFIIQPTRIPTTTEDLRFQVNLFSGTTIVDPIVDFNGLLSHTEWDRVITLNREAAEYTTKFYCNTIDPVNPNGDTKDQEILEGAGVPVFGNNISLWAISGIYGAISGLVTQDTPKDWTTTGDVTKDFVMLDPTTGEEIEWDPSLVISVVEEGRKVKFTTSSLQHIVYKLGYKLSDDKLFTFNLVFMIDETPSENPDSDVIDGFEQLTYTINNGDTNKIKDTTIDVPSGQSITFTSSGKTYLFNYYADGIQVEPLYGTKDVSNGLALSGAATFSANTPIAMVIDNQIVVRFNYA